MLAVIARPAKQAVAIFDNNQKSLIMVLLQKSWFKTASTEAEIYRFGGASIIKDYRITSGFPLEFIPHTMRGGNDNEECRIPIKTIGIGIELSSSPSI